MDKMSIFSVSSKQMYFSRVLYVINNCRGRYMYMGQLGLRTLYSAAFTNCQLICLSE